MAPEYATRGYLTDKADVYSFGIVAIEIVSGKSNTNYRPKEEFVYLLDWVNYFSHAFRRFRFSLFVIHFTILWILILFSSLTFAECEGLCPTRARESFRPRGSYSRFKILRGRGNEDVKFGTVVHKSVSYT